MQLSADDRARIGAAVKAAEATTDGEIVAIAAAQSDAYHDVALQWSVLGMFLVLAVQAAVPGHFVPLLEWARGGWSRWTIGELLVALMVLLGFVFLVLRVAFAPVGVRMVLTPRVTKARRVRRRAVTLFRASIEARTASRTGVLLYLSLAEHQAEIVTDEAVLKAVPQEAWGDTMAALLDAIRDDRPGEGMVAAIERIGAILAQHFPHTGNDPNELPDQLIEL